MYTLAQRHASLGDLRCFWTVTEVLRPHPPPPAGCYADQSTHSRAQKQIETGVKHPRESNFTNASFTLQAWPVLLPRACWYVPSFAGPIQKTHSEPGNAAGSTPRSALRVVGRSQCLWVEVASKSPFQRRRMAVLNADSSFHNDQAARRLLTGLITWKAVKLRPLVDFV